MRKHRTDWLHGILDPVDDDNQPEPFWKGFLSLMSIIIILGVIGLFMAALK